MIIFRSIASSSKGNAYLVQSHGMAPLLLEAGLPIRMLREKLEFGLSGLAGCLISHEHQDHAKAVKDLLKAGVDCGMSKGTADALNVGDHHRVWIMQPGERHQLGAWIIIPFALEHDAAGPTGFLISHGEDRLLFIPDTAYIKNRFSGITTISIECNHIESILSDNIQSGLLDQSVGRRVRRNHLSLENLIAMLKSNDLSRCRKIYLLHLSDGNSDEQRMVREVQAATGIPTEACA